MSKIIFRDLYCKKCFLQFDKKYVFDCHLALVHGEEIKVKKEPVIKEEKFDEFQQSEKQFEKHFKCNNCSVAFPTKPRLNRHVTAVHEGKKPFQCSICDSSFAEKGSLKKHIASVHEGKKPFQCNTCDATFAQNSELMV